MIVASRAARMLQRKPRDECCTILEGTGAASSQQSDGSIGVPDGDVLPGGDDVTVLTSHFSAYSQDGTKKKQIDLFVEELTRLDAAGQRFVAGGDFNALPPGSTQTHDFEDSVCEGEDFQADDFREETEWLVPLYERWMPAIPLADYQANNAPYFTHTTDSHGFWNRKLDYLFTNGTFTLGSGHTHQSLYNGGIATMSLSDHAPTSVLLEVAP